MTTQFIKWSPIVVLAMMGLSFVLALNGNYWGLNHLSGKFGCALLILPPYMWITSNKWHFCHWHKAFIITDTVVSLATNLKIDLGWNDDFVMYLRIALLISILGVFASSVLFFRYGCFKTNFKKSLN